MALSKPVLNPISAWDVTKGTTFTFNVIGGDQVIGSKLSIYEYTDLSEPVYENTISSYNYEHTVPANAVGLTNNNYYYATITTIGVEEGSESTPSDYIEFPCYETPTFNFTNIRDDGIVNSSEYKFTAYYKQARGEELLTYRFNLYNEQGTLIKTSGLLYGANLIKKYEGRVNPEYDWHYDIEYLVQGLENLTTYYIEMVGTAYGNMSLTTGRIRFVVDYQGEIDNVLIKATNQCNDGNILITSYLDVMNGESKYDPIYIDNKEIDLRGTGSRMNNVISWDDLADQTDFSIRLVFRAPITSWGETQPVNLMTIGGVGGLYYLYDPETKESVCRFPTFFDDADASTSTFVGIPNDHIKYVLVLKRVSGVWSVEWSVYDYPSGTLYVEGDNAYISVLDVMQIVDGEEVLTPLTTNTTYTYDEDTGELEADAPDNYDFDYEADGDIILTI